METAEDAPQTRIYPFVTYKGWDFIPTITLNTKGPEEHFNYIRNFKTRPTDIILSSPMKAGTHWLHEILSMLLTQKTEYNTLGPWWNLNLEYIRQPEEIEKLAGPRIFSSHIPFSFLPKSHIDNGYKIVYLNRNPKDRFVSNKFFFEGKIGAPNWTWSEYFDEHVMNDRLYTGWFNYTKEMIKAVQNKSANIFPVMFEDLIINPKEHLTELAAFLEVSVTGEFIDEVVEKCSFENLKNNKFDVSTIVDPNRKSTLFRKGTIGDWKNWFTVAQAERFDALYATEMEGFDVEFIYELPEKK